MIKNKGRIFYTLFFLAYSYMLIAQNQSNAAVKSALTIGDKWNIHSLVLDEERALNIYLPASYHPDSLKRYPVIYLLDGSYDEDFIHIAGLVQFGSFPWINMLPESIVVGIANVDRRRDFTFPTNNLQDKKDFPTTGSSGKFIHFLEKELQPFINEKYPTTSDKTIIGQSLGGLLATEILLNKTNLFDHYIIISPSLWWDDESILIKDIKLNSPPKSIYIGVGKEGEVMERLAASLYEKLKTLDLKNTLLLFNYFEQLDHGDTLHLAVYDAFEKIFRKEE